MAIGFESFEYLKDHPEASEIGIGGGVALSHYSSRRKTFDLDAWWRSDPKPETILAVLRYLRSYAQKFFRPSDERGSAQKSAKIAKTLPILNSIGTRLMPGNFLDSNVTLYLASGQQAKADRAEENTKTRPRTRPRPRSLEFGFGPIFGFGEPASQQRQLVWLEGRGRVRVRGRLFACWYV